MNLIKELIARRLSCDFMSKLTKEGRIHSVFESALNIQFNDGLLTILKNGKCLFPRSALLVEDVSFAEMGFVQGETVKSDENVIFLGNRAIVTLNNAEITPLSLTDTAMTEIIDSALFRERMETLSDIIQGCENAEESLAPVLGEMFGTFEMAHNVWSRFLIKRIIALFDVIRRQDASENFKAEHSIAGCGPGLTPSSDDFLVGIFAALYGAAASGFMESEIAKHMCRKLCEAALPATGSISAGFIESGSNGRFSEDVLYLIMAFFEEDDLSKIIRHARGVCSYGSTSGVDMLCGIWLGFMACLDIK